MNSIQIRALLMTILVLGVSAYFLLGKPNLHLDTIKDRVSAIFSSDAEEKKPKKTIPKKKGNRISPIGKVVDTYKGVKIFDNGSVTNVSGRNVTADGYNLGLKYQCVEFVKRYYYERYGHKMPDSYGHAKDFFDHSLSDGAFNSKRALYQYSNNGNSRPQVDDLIVFGATPYNRFGHVAIISRVGNDYIEIAQQNPGKGNSSRAKYALTKSSRGWNVANQYVLGWLRR